MKDLSRLYAIREALGEFSDPKADRLLKRLLQR